MEEYKKALRNQIELKKKRAIENIQEEKIVPAMWDLSELIDLKAQLSALEKVKED